MSISIAIVRRINDNLSLVDFPSQTGAITTIAASSVEVNAGIMVRSIACDSAVNAGDPIRYNSDGKAFQALATNQSNANFIGIAVTKETQTMCHIRFAALTSAIYTNLVRNDDYFLGVTGGITNTAPGSGTVVIRVGTANDSQTLAIYKGTMVVKA